MLQMRARGFALRDAFADVLKGFNIREEVEDYLREKAFIPSTKNNQSLIKELEQQLQSENEVSVMEIKQKIKSSQTQDELNALAGQIKKIDYSEQNKAEIRSVFKDKKASFLQTNPESQSNLKG